MQKVHHEMESHKINLSFKNVLILPCKHIFKECVMGPIIKNGESLGVLHFITLKICAKEWLLNKAPILNINCPSFWQVLNDVLNYRRL